MRKFIFKTLFSKKFKELMMEMIAELSVIMILIIKHFFSGEDFVYL